ncbi:MAG: BrnA antitoxin family protein [Geothrix sp.]|nr:BrnA antitoxin family protein [Geothrix sp.]
MKNKKPLTDDEGEVRELTAEDMKDFRPIQEVLPVALLYKLGVRGPQKTPTKDRINIRLSHDVVEHFRATGPGWQSRIDEALREWVRTHNR